MLMCSLRRSIGVKGHLCNNIQEKDEWILKSVYNNILMYEASISIQAYCVYL